MRLTLLLMLLIAHTPSVAQDGPLPASETGSPTKAPTGCVDVVVDGHAALSYDCLNQQLMPKGGHAGPPGSLASEAATQSSPNALGLFNQATTSNRMGSNFGTSAFPQRPPRPSAPHPFGPPQP